MSNDTELLRRYADSRSEEAFALFVEHNLSLVYFAALRRTNGDVHLAEDVAQQVFSSLAQEARSVARHATPVGWLYVATRNAAANDQTRRAPWLGRFPRLPTASWRSSKSAAGGSVLVVDALATGTPAADRARAIYGFHLAMRTRSGRVHSPVEIGRWMKEAGCEAPTPIALDDRFTDSMALGAIVARRN